MLLEHAILAYKPQHIHNPIFNVLREKIIHNGIHVKSSWLTHKTYGSDWVNFILKYKNIHKIKLNPTYKDILDCYNIPMLIPSQEYALELCDIPASIDLYILKSCIDDYMKPRIQCYKDMNRSLTIEDEFSEYWLSKASSGAVIGKGNVSTDVITSHMEGIDSMCVVMNGKTSNEKSLIQNFKEFGNELDSLFIQGNSDTAIKLYMDGLKQKLDNVKQKYNLTELYILAYISMPDSVYICCFKYNIELIDKVSGLGFSTQKQSMYMDGFINPKYGKVSLYKAKKRVELRLDVSCVIDNPFAVKIYSLP